MVDRITGEKNPIVALILNLCCSIFGLGYFYIGQWQKALALIGINVLIILISFVIPFITIIPSLAVWVICIIDAFQQADILQKGGAISHWTFFGKSES